MHRVRVIARYAALAFAVITLLVVMQSLAVLDKYAVFSGFAAVLGMLKLAASS